MENGLILKPEISENLDPCVIKYILGDRYIYLIREEEKRLYIKINNYDRDRLGEIYKGEVYYEELRKKMTLRDLKDEDIYTKLNQIFKDRNNRNSLLCREGNKQLQFSYKYEEPDKVEVLFVLYLDHTEDIELLNWELKFLEKEKEKISKEIKEAK